MEKLEFKKIAAGVWRGKINDADNTGILRFLTTGQKLDSINSGYQDCDFPLDGVFGKTVCGKNVVCVPFERSERIYGLGLGFRSLTQNYQVKHLHCDHYGAGGDNGRTHVPTPFYVSDKGYGIYIDTSEYISFYVGGSVRKDAKNPPKEQNRGRDDDWSATTVGEFVEASFEGTGACIYVFAGNSALEVVSKFNLFCGGGALVPKWGLGFWQRVHIRYGADDVEKEIRSFEEHDFPVDVIGLEPGWQNNSYPCSFEWDEERFPDPEKFVGDLLDKGIRVNLWENLFVSKKSSVHDELIPYSGSHMVWNGLVPDFTMAEAKDIYSRIHDDKHVSIGVSGYKVDECDGFDGWLFPDHAEFPSGNDAPTIRSTLGITAQNALYDLYHKHNKRTYGLVRASNTGSAAMPFCIYNDCYSFKDYMTGLASASFCGTLWVPEVRDADTAEEWVRRFQMCVFSPMLMLNSWANGVKPWQFPEVENIVRDTIEFRRSLVPYLYNAFYAYYKKGIPPFRAFCLDFPVPKNEERTSLDHTANPYETLVQKDITESYMAGDCVMVTVVRPGETSKKVPLPDCNWYDYYTGKFVGRNEVVELQCPLDRMLILVREGGMIPVLEDGKLTVRCYGEKGSMELYDDDGVTFDFENGAYSLTALSFEKKNGQLTGTCKKIYEGEGFVSGYGEVTFIQL